MPEASRRGARGGRSGRGRERKGANRAAAVVRRIARGLAGLLLAMMSAGPLWAGSSNSLLDVSSDGRWLAAANRDNGTVSVVDLESLKVVHEVQVGKKPEGVSFVGPTAQLAVTCYADDTVVLVDALAGRVHGRLDVLDEPYGIVSSADGTRLYATLEYPGAIVEIDPATRQVLRMFSVGSMLRGLALDPLGKRLYATEYLTGRVHAVDVASGEPVDRWDAIATENLARQIALHPRRGKAYLPLIRSRTNVNRGEGSVVPFVKILDTAAGTAESTAARRKLLPMDGFHSVFVVANPWEVALSPDGSRLIAVFAGTDDAYACRVVDDDYQELVHEKTLRLGSNPRAVRFSPDGSRFFVYNTLAFEVAVFDSRTLLQTNKIAVCKNPLDDEVLQGKILFYSALEPMVGRRWISCASCHPDGDADGRTWQNPEGLRNTTPLFGMAYTHPIHWSADRDEVQDFEHTIRSPLMQGRGLLRGTVHESLAAANRGRSSALDALAAYSNSHAFTLSPHAKGGLSDAARRGQALFHSAEVGCASCHSGPFYTDSRPEKPFRVHDVGTGADDPSETMGPRYDTPTLLGVYRTAPYLHHGKAATLEAVLTTANPGDQHGHTSQLTKDEVADLVEFLKALPFEDPLPAAKSAGLTAVER